MHPASSRLARKNRAVLSWSRAIPERQNHSLRLQRSSRRGVTSCCCSAHLVRVFRPVGGFTLTTDSEAPAGAGIGGSSAMAVAICAALDRLTGAGLRREDWIHISRDIEAIVIRVPTGTQDHYPPAFGGAAAIVLAPAARSARPSAATSTISGSDSCCATRENPGNTGSTTGKCSSAILTAIVAWRRISNKSRRFRATFASGRTQPVERTRPPGARGMGIPPPESSLDLDSAYRQRYYLSTEKRRSGRESLRCGRRGVSDISDRTRCA